MSTFLDEDVEYLVMNLLTIGGATEDLLNCSCLNLSIRCFKKIPVYKFVSVVAVHIVWRS